MSGETNECNGIEAYNTTDLKTAGLLGCLIGSIFYGILVQIGYDCLTMLPKKRGETNRGVITALMLYVAVILVVATVEEAWTIRITMDDVLGDTLMCKADGSSLPPNPFAGPINIVFLAVGLITDGSLVWRCYVIATGLRRRVWSKLWILPLVLYIAMAGTGIGALVYHHASSTHTLTGTSDPFTVAQFSMTLLFNTGISSSLIFLLLSHRREITRSFPGRETQLPYLSIVAVIVESACIVIFADIFALCTIGLFSVGSIAILLWAQLQPISSFLIIARVAHGDDVFSRQQSLEEIRLPMPPSPPSLQINLDTVDSSRELK